METRKALEKQVATMSQEIGQLSREMMALRLLIGYLQDSLESLRTEKDATRLE